MKTYEYLTDAQVEQFVENGYIVLHDSFDLEKAEEWKALAFRRLGYDANDPATWKEERIHMPGMNSAVWSEFAPKAWGAACELVGGADRMQEKCWLSDGFIVNFHEGIDRAWQPPSPDVKGWHKDGDFFLHFLDSPEQALLSLILWSDIEPQGGGTFVAPDSVGVVARFLAQHPEGVEPNGFGFQTLIRECHEFKEFTGRQGDIVLLHPYMLHTTSQNHSGRPRFLTNPAMHLREPMHFNRDDPEDFSPVERAVLRGLGVERLDFQPTSPRRKIVPERERIQQKMREEEAARLAQAAP